MKTYTPNYKVKAIQVTQENKQELAQKHAGETFGNGIQVTIDGNRFMIYTGQWLVFYPDGTFRRMMDSTFKELYH